MSALLRRTWPIWLGVLLRFATFPFAENLYGDAPVRTELAARWANDAWPFWSQAQVFQFGPLPLWLGGIAIRLGLGVDTGPRLMSLLAGCLGLWLAWRVGRRAGGESGGRMAALVVALSPLHIQASTTFVSESFYVAFLLALVDRSWARDLRSCAVLLFALTTSRYDAWLWLPCWVIWWAWTAPGGRLRPFVMAGLIAGVGPTSIALANLVDTGDPLGPLRYIAHEHVQLAESALAQHGPIGWRAYSLFYWLGALAVVMTPGFFLAGVRSLWQRTSEMRERLLPLTTGFVPIVIYAGRAVLFATFWPMARLALAPGVLLATVMPPPSRRVLVACIAAAIASNVALVATTLSGGAAAAEVGPVTPLSRIPDDLRAGAEAIRHGPPIVALEKVANWEDIPIAYHSGRSRFEMQPWSWRFPTPPARVVTLRGGAFDTTLRAGEPLFDARYRLTGEHGRVAWWDRVE